MKYSRIGTYQCAGKSWFLIALMCGISFFQGFAQGIRNKDILPPPLPLFQYDDVLKITIHSDFQELLADRGDERQEHPATLSYNESDGSSGTQDVQLRVRGNFRRQLQNCGFPPLRLNLRKKAVEQTIFHGQDKLKLVTHCQNKEKGAEQRILLEYLIYKIYNILTEYSFNVRLVLINYVDTSGQRKELSRHGFLIESEEELALRLGGKVIKKEGIHQDSTDYNQVAMLSIFQYLAGNTDWSVPALHNIKLISLPDGRLIPVPYDFDWSGLVDAPYATPARNIPVEDVRTRFYRGYCRSREIMQTHLDLFNERRDAIQRQVYELEPLSRKNRKLTTQYINQFYKTINSSKRVNKQFLKTCR